MFCDDEPETAACLWLDEVALRTVLPVLEGVVLTADEVLEAEAVAVLLSTEAVLLTLLVEVVVERVVVLPAFEERSLLDVDEVPSPPRSDVRLVNTLSEPV